jgi:hypothetical protein
MGSLPSRIGYGVSWKISISQMYSVPFFKTSSARTPYRWRATQKSLKSTNVQFLSLLTCTCYAVLDRLGTHHPLAGCLEAIAFARPYDLILIRGVRSCWDFLL